MGDECAGGKKGGKPEKEREKRERRRDRVEVFRFNFISKHDVPHHISDRVYLHSS